MTLSPAPPGRIETLNGTEIYFEVHGTGEPLLLLHGFSGSSQDWAAVVTEWRTDFQLIVPDLRGHGRSSILSKPFRHQDAARDMLALLAHLKVGACRGLGISGGGNVLLRVGSRIREGWRWVKDKYAESSIAAIDQRIAEQEKYRNSLQRYLDSDKAFYLDIVRSMVSILLFMCLAGMVLILGRLKVIPTPLSDIMPLGVLVLAITVAIATMQLGNLRLFKNISAYQED